MPALSTLLRCCCISPDQEHSDAEKHFFTQYKDNPSPTEVADDIISKLFAAEKNDLALRADLESTVHTYGWYDNLAAAILEALKQAIERKKEMGPVVKAAYDKAVAGVNQVREWAGAHPKMAAVIITLIALGILAVTVPWLMSFLGFTEGGILEASWAASWQAEFDGLVPKGSLFSYLQSLGTKIGRNWLKK